MLRELFKEVLYQYPNASLKLGAKGNVHKVIAHEIPDALVQAVTISDKYKVYGSSGAGNWAEVPWVAICDKAVTTSTTKGFYVVYLFDADSKGFYLSLVLGWTQFKVKYPPKVARQMIQQTTGVLEAYLHSPLPGFEYGSIDLHAQKPLGKGYEVGQICSKYYSREKIPNDEILKEDLQILLGAYREIKGLAGNDIFKLKKLGLDEEELFQEDINQSSALILPSGPIPVPKKRVLSRGSSWNRNPKISKSALENADWKCEFDVTHGTFISKSTEKMYLEAHHLVPMEHQYQFSCSIDVPENILCLCPNCHRKIHLAKDETRKDLLEQFLIKRREQLSDRGICVSTENLFLYYGCDSKDK